MKAQEATKNSQSKKVKKKTGAHRTQNKKRTSRRKHTAPFTHKSKTRRKSNKEKMRMIPIGGMGEIGKNMTVFEYKNQAIIIDCGLKFPDDDMLGVDIVIPDFDYIKNNRDKIKGIIITHGHEDHIGGISYLIQEQNIPIYATKLTMGLIDKKLKEKGLFENAERNIIKAGDKFRLGEFEIEPIHVNHSIADSVALAIKTPAATVVHTGDFKVDYQPVDGKIIDLQRFGELGAEGVDLLLADSTNVENSGFTPSESSIGETFLNIFKGNKNRIIVTTFASNVHRLQQVIDAAVAYNRKVAVNGRSMENMIDVASELGYIKIPKNTLIDIREMKNYKPKEVVVLTTGSQGEPMAALGRMANGTHSSLDIGENDTIIISATPVPGNEKMVSEVINKLIQKGADVIYNKFVDTHVSGHANREELKLIQALVKPKFFVPVHGESRMLLHHSNLAQDLGLNPKNVFLMENGQELEFDKNSARIIEETVKSEPIMVDGLGIGDIGQIVLSDRKRLSEDGLFIVVQKMHGSKPVGNPDIISRGFVYVKESGNLMDEAKQVVLKALEDAEAKNLTEWEDLKPEIRSHLQKFLFKQTQRSPMILPILINV